MSVIAGPAGTAITALGPIAQILPPQYRFAGDDWADANAFVFTFYSVLPTFGAPTLNPTTGAVVAPGAMLTQGTIQNLAGCTFSGTLSYAPRPVSAFPASAPSPSPVPMVGTINATTGQGTLTLLSPVTSTFPQQAPSVWANAISGDTSGALLILQARLVDSLGATGTQAVIPLYVF